MMIITAILQMLRNGFVLSKTVIFIWGLVLSHALVNKGVVDVFADFLGDDDYNLWKTTMLVSFLDGLSAVLKVAVIHVSEAYIGRFMAIIFCTAAFIMGLVILWIRASHPDIVTLVFAIVLIALGTAGKEPTLRDFFDYQLSEKVKKKCTEKNEGEDRESSQEKERSDKNDSRTTNLWWSVASVIGYVTASLLLGSASWQENFGLSSIVMGATCLLFIIGIFCFSLEKPSESPLTIIYRVFKAAIKKRKLPYPSSKQGYNNEGLDGLSEDLFYEKENGEVHLLPRHPSFLLFLDRAAMMNNSDGEERVVKEEVCAVVQVRDVKNFYLVLPLGITLFAYSLVSASGNTYFVLQASNLGSYSIGGFYIPIMVFFAIKSLVTFVVRIIQSRYTVVRPLWSMGVGMFCSVICSIAAWQVECRRLSLIRFLKKPEDEIPISIMILTPQYVLLGLMEGFAEGGLEDFLSDRLYSESMKNFAGPCIEMLLGIGKFSSILFALVFHMWIKDAINRSRLDKYFLLLASLSFVYLGIYIFYAKFKFQRPQFVFPAETIQETITERMDELLPVQVDILIDS
ncbi:protein NRT1/ PTR FAMILY 5.6-like [Neltuma alba]|uniref:protein NRT1/ PTR FAMILY 5.6-like n=1 Tax=Neltuma alba TaxID=207710 RepID=UPI0010A2C1E1|nr:protein NRT1/ PTR FAMILY 5.6-like [Prosopis alba]